MLILIREMDYLCEHVGPQMYFLPRFTEVNLSSSSEIVIGIQTIRLKGNLYYEFVFEKIR